MANKGPDDSVLQRLELIDLLFQQASADAKPSQSEDLRLWAARQLERCNQVRALLVDGNDWTWANQSFEHRQLRTEYANWVSALTDSAIDILSGTSAVSPGSSPSHGSDTAHRCSEHQQGDDAN